MLLLSCLMNFGRCTALRCHPEVKPEGSASLAHVTADLLDTSSGRAYSDAIASISRCGRLPARRLRAAAGADASRRGSLPPIVFKSAHRHDAPQQRLHGPRRTRCCDSRSGVPCAGRRSNGGAAPRAGSDMVQRATGAAVRTRVLWESTSPFLRTAAPRCSAFRSGARSRHDIYSRRGILGSAEFARATVRVRERSPTHSVRSSGRGSLVRTPSGEPPSSACSVSVVSLVQLIQQANREGQRMESWHYTAALDSLGGIRSFAAFVRPRD